MLDNLWQPHTAAHLDLSSARTRHPDYWQPCFSFWLCVKLQTVFFLLCQNCTQCKLLNSIFSTFFSLISRIKSNCKRLKVNNCKMNKYRGREDTHVVAKSMSASDNHFKDLETDKLNFEPWLCIKMFFSVSWLLFLVSKSDRVQQRERNVSINEIKNSIVF